MINLSMVSQTTSEDVKIEIKEDTVLLKLHVDEARLILGDLLDFEHVDSLLAVYKIKDSVNLEIINKKDIIIINQKEKIENYTIEIENSKQIIKNKDAELGILLNRIKDLEKDINKLRRQKKFLSILSISGPILVLILISNVN